MPTERCLRQIRFPLVSRVNSSPESPESSYFQKLRRKFKELLQLRCVKVETLKVSDTKTRLKAISRLLSGSPHRSSRRLSMIYLALWGQLQ